VWFLSSDRMLKPRALRTYWPPYQKGRGNAAQALTSSTRMSDFFPN
jgi:hypothetical protein